MKRILLVLAAFGLILGMSGIAMATSYDTGDLTVTASVTAACTISDGALAFGTYDPFSSSDKTGNTVSTVQVTCTNSTPWRVYSTTATKEIITGTGGSGEVLTYTLWSDSGYSVPLPTTDITGAITGDGNGAAQDATIYGKMVKNQNVKPGSYTNAASKANLTVAY